MDDNFENGSVPHPVTLAESLAIMTRRPRRLVMSQTPGTLGEEALAVEYVDGTDPALHTEMSIMEDRLISDSEQFTPDTGEFTAEMAQAILNSGASQPLPTETGSFPMPVTPDAAHVSEGDGYDAMGTSYQGNPDASEDSRPAPSYSQEYLEPTPRPALDEMPDMLAGFDPSKYLAGASAAAPAVAAQEATHEPNYGDRQDEIPAGVSDSSAYDDIEQGAGTGGQKDSREAMQMLRELSVLRETY